MFTDITIVYVQKFLLYFKNWSSVLQKSTYDSVFIRIYILEKSTFLIKHSDYTDLKIKKRQLSDFIFLLHKSSSKSSSFVCCKCFDLIFEWSFVVIKFDRSRRRCLYKNFKYFKETHRRARSELIKNFMIFLTSFYHFRFFHHFHYFH